MRDGPITRQKQRVAHLRGEIAELDGKRSRLLVQLEEAEAALASLTGKKVEAAELPLGEGAR